MRHEQLISTISSETNLSKENTKRVIDTFIKLISNEIKKGNEIKVQNLGTFGTKTSNLKNKKRIPCLTFSWFWYF